MGLATVQPALCKSQFEESILSLSGQSVLLEIINTHQLTNSSPFFFFLANVYFLPQCISELKWNLVPQDCVGSGKSQYPNPRVYLERPDIWGRR